MRISDWSSDVCSSDLASLWLMQNGVANPNNAGAAAYSYMNLLGIVAMGLMWLRAARAAQAALDAGADDRSFFEAKLVTAHFFAERSEEHTSELQSLMRISYAVFCFKKKKQTRQ